MAKLTFVLEQGEEVVVPLADAATLTLGRGDDNDVVVDDSRVSAHHAALERNADGSLEVRDLNSSAGTFVNGERVQSRCIHDGDTVAFGPLTAVVDLEDFSPRFHETSHGKENGSNGRGHDHDRARAVLFQPAAHGDGNGSPPHAATGEPQADGSFSPAAARREELARLEAEKARLESEVAALQTGVREHAAVQARVQTEAAAARAQLQSWRESSAREMREHAVRMETLHADEKRLAHVKTAVAEAAALHQQWTAAVQALSAEHAEKGQEVQRLLAAETAARQEIDALSAHKDQELACLQQLQEERQHDEAHLEALRQQITAQEQRHQHIEELAAAREDQVTLAEKKLADIAGRRARLEAHVKELASSEEKLEQALARNQEADAQHSALLAAIGMLAARKLGLESAIAELGAKIKSAHGELKQRQAALEETQAGKSRAEEALHCLQAEIKARQQELAAETARLQEASARRAEIIQQCEDLADTKQELGELEAKAAAAEQRQAELQESLAAKEDRLREAEIMAVTLSGKEEAAKGRLEALQARENALHAELEKLAADEHGARGRFEEIRQLMTEAEIEQQALAEEHAAKAKARQQELDALESKLVPLRDWEEAMDQLYARLAELPENSKEARELWHTIEKEKDALKDLICSARSQAGEPIQHQAARPERRLAPQVVPDSVIILTAAEEALQGAGTSSTLQERTLRSRLNHLRECVQREESRLEFLRQERGRQEVRLRTSAPGAEGVQREHDRHLETKIRHDEEQLSALHQHIEQAKAEEEKRQARIAEMEHKLAELHADMADAERRRSELRHQAELAQSELKNFESALERMKKTKAEGATKAKA